MDNLLYKEGLTEKELMMVEGELESKKRETWVTWVLYLFFGGLGIHRFYLKDTGYAVAMLLTTLFTAVFTFGLSTFVWLIVELFLIQKRINFKNTELEKQLINRVKVLNR